MTASRALSRRLRQTERVEQTLSPVVAASGIARADEIRGRTWCAGFIVFALLAAVVLALPVGDLGWRVLGLVIVFHIGTVALARSTGDRLLWRAWTVLAPLSILMVLPDWFLSAELRVLEFPDTGGPFIGTVPLFMAGMWTIALMPVVLIGSAVAVRQSLGVATAVASGVGLVMFWAAELVAPMIPLWQPVGVAQLAGVATYVIVPELVLSGAAFVIVATAGLLPRTATVALVILLPFTYLGMLASSYQFLG